MRRVRIFMICGVAAAAWPGSVIASSCDGVAGARTDAGGAHPDDPVPVRETRRDGKVLRCKTVEGGSRSSEEEAAGNLRRGIGIGVPSVLTVTAYNPAT